MKNNYAFYYQKDNVIFNSDILSVCYRATSDEIKKYGLTSENIIILLKSKKLIIKIAIILILLKRVLIKIFS